MEFSFRMDKPVIDISKKDNDLMKNDILVLSVFSKKIRKFT